MFGKDHARALARAVGAVAALAEAVEAVAGRDHPGIGSRPLQVLAKVFKDGGIFRRQGGEVVDRFIDAGGQARGRNVVAQNAAIDNLREKGRLRNQFLHQVRNVLLAFRSERFLIPGAASKSDDHDFSVALQYARPSEQAAGQESAGKRETRRVAKEFPAAPGDAAGNDRKLSHSDLRRRSGAFSIWARKLDSWAGGVLL